MLKKTALFCSWLPLRLRGTERRLLTLPNALCYFFDRGESGSATILVWHHLCLETEARGSEEWRETAGGESSGAGKGSRVKIY